LASGRLSALLAVEIAATGGRPPIEAELHALIRQMSRENLLWGAPRIHGELLKLGFEVAQSTVETGASLPKAKCVAGWVATANASDRAVVPTIPSFDIALLHKSLKQKHRR
jgi:hypothetical protein